MFHEYGTRERLHVQDTRVKPSTWMNALTSWHFSIRHRRKWEAQTSQGSCLRVPRLARGQDGIFNPSSHVLRAIPISSAGGGNQIYIKKLEENKTNKQKIAQRVTLPRTDQILRSREEEWGAQNI